MTDATIVIPTYRHAALLPYAIRSALDQQSASIELFVVGDGVEDDTRAAVEEFLPDSRVRFFDFPKGEHNGELGRHEALQSASGSVVCYLSDDDLLLPDHVVEMLRLLEDADFAHSAPLVVDARRIAPLRADRHGATRVPRAPPARRLEQDLADRRCPHAGVVPTPSVRLAARTGERLERPQHVAAVRPAALVSRAHGNPSDPSPHARSGSARGLGRRARSRARALVGTDPGTGVRRRARTDGGRCRPGGRGSARGSNPRAQGRHSRDPGHTLVALAHASGDVSAHRARHAGQRTR